MKVFQRDSALPQKTLGGGGGGDCGSSWGEKRARVGRLERFHLEEAEAVSNLGSKKGIDHINEGKESVGRGRKTLRGT